MIVICAGMPKAGTAWHFNLVDTLLRAAGGRGAHAVRDARGLADLMRGRNCTLANLDAHSLATLTALAAEGESFAVKTHEAPTPAIVPLLLEGRLEATYIYRDPRDAMLSALEYGVRLRSMGIIDETFSTTRTLIDAAQRYIGNLALCWEQWRLMPRTRVVRYEDLLADPAAEVEGLGAALGLDVGPGVARDVVRMVAEEVGAGRNAQGVLHFNEGRVGRFREVMTAAEQRFCAEVFGPWLTMMGYDPAVEVVGDPPGVALHLTALALGGEDRAGRRVSL